MFSTKDLEVYVAKSTSAVELKFVRSQADVLDDSLTFPSQFTHQVFGEREVIFGYKNLKVKVYFTPDTLDTYIGLTYDSKIDPAQHRGTKPDDVVRILSDYIPPGFSTNLDEYIVRISRPRKFLPFGELLRAYRRDDITYEVYKADLTCPGFSEYHDRMQTFLLLFIDASSFIDVDDDKWTFYVIFEKRRVNEGVHFSLVGYTSVYSFYAYPDKIRPRLSQMLIFPPFQRKGHGAELLQAIYDDLVPRPEVLDITVEDPSEEFGALRDFVDCRNAMKLSSFQPPMIHKEYADSAEKDCRSKLKLQKKQGLRVYEILRLRSTDRSNSQQYMEYRMAVKNKINGPFKREQKDMKRLQKLVDPTELALTHPQTSPDDHVENLHRSYKEMEEEYMKIIEKLAASPEF